MDFGTNSGVNWADDAFLALRGDCEKWRSTMSGGGDAFAPAAFSTVPSAISQTAFERYGQVTPPEELSPVIDPAADGLPPNAFWDKQHASHDLTTSGQQQPSSEPTQAGDAAPAPKRRRTTRQSTTSQNSAQISAQPSAQSEEAAPPQQPEGPKRKRGRPKIQAQAPKAEKDLTTDAYPFPVSSARQSHLEKNRVAAHKCRERRKQYIKDLEFKAREYSAKNKMLRETVTNLREEVLGLKNILLQHAGCGCWAIDQYLAQSAGDLLGVQNPFVFSRKTSDDSMMRSPSLAASTRNDGSISQGMSPVQNASDVQDSVLDSFGDFSLLKDFDDEVDNPTK